MLYISQLLEIPRLEQLAKRYPIGIEVISFSIGFVLDELETSIASYEQAFQELRQKVPFTFHGPFLDLLPGSCDAKVQALVHERFESAYKAAKAFGVDQMIFHTGYMPDTYPDPYWLENVIAFWKKFLQGKTDCTFYVENVLDRDWKLLKQLVEGVNLPNFKVCLDVGHANAYSKVPLEEWIVALGEQIGYVHLHNNDGSKDAHGGLLDGSIPMEVILHHLKAYAPHATWSLEISDETALIQSLDWLTKKNFL